MEQKGFNTLSPPSHSSPPAAGTGQVVVRLVDVNDNSPRLEQRLWEVELDETWGDGPPDDASLLEITVVDPDTSNYFFYRVSTSDFMEREWGRKISDGFMAHQD